MELSGVFLLSPQLQPIVGVTSHMVAVRKRDVLPYPLTIVRDMVLDGDPAPT